MTRFIGVRQAGLAAAGLATVLFGLLAITLHRESCGENACPRAPVGPTGVAVSDRFYFVHQPLTGDGSITVRVTGLTGRIKEPPPSGTRGPGPEPVPGVVPWAKAGLMIKDGVRQGASYAAVMVTGEHGVRMQHDFVHDTAGSGGKVTADSLRWLRLSRHGDTVTGFESADGTTWQQVGEVRLELPGTVRIGLFAASPGALTPGAHGTDSRFSEVTATFDVDRDGPWSQDDIGVLMEPDGVTPHHPGGLAGSGRQLAVTGVGEIGPATSDGGRPMERFLVGAAAGMVIVIITFCGAGTSRRTLMAAGWAFLVGSVAASAALLIGKQLLLSAGTPFHTVAWHTEVRLILGTGALLATAAVLSAALGVLLGRRLPAIVLAVTVLVLPHLLAVTLPVLPAAAAQWLLRVTPAAGFAILQSVPAYPQSDFVGLPANGYYPLPPWAGLAVAAAFTALAVLAAARRARPAPVAAQPEREASSLPAQLR